MVEFIGDRISLPGRRPYTRPSTFCGTRVLDAAVDTASPGTMTRSAYIRKRRPHLHGIIRVREGSGAVECLFASQKLLYDLWFCESLVRPASALDHRFQDALVLGCGFLEEVEQDVHPAMFPW